MDLQALSEDDLFLCANWAQERGLWDGREFTLENFSPLSEAMEEKIKLLLDQQSLSDVELYQLSASLAYLGTAEEDRDALFADVKELGLLPNGALIQPAGFSKSISKFWKNHKTAIIVGSAIVGVITTVAIVAITSGGTAAGAAVAAGSAALNGLKKYEEDQETPREPTKPFGSIAFPEDCTFLKGPESLASMPLDLLAAPQIPSWCPPLETPGILRNFPYEVSSVPIWSGLTEKAPPYSSMDVLGPPPLPFNQPVFFERNLPVFSSSDKGLTKSWPQWVSEMIGLSDDAPLPPPPQNNFSMTFTTKGERCLSEQVIGVNGIANSLEDAIKHAEYLKSCREDRAFDWVYNHSNTSLLDLGETALLNFQGFSPNTGKLLQENWVAFHEQNKDNPNAKCLQFCHSQGAVHVRNALAFAPEEIRQRVIVVAIAPATIIPKGLCFQATNYASKLDPISKGEIAVAGFFEAGEVTASARTREALEIQGELILLDPHPDATGIDHDFQSPTFYKVIKDHLDSYFEKNREFE